MKSTLIIIPLTFLATTAFSQNVGIGTSNFTPTSDALLEMRSTNSGFLMPRMTDAQKNSISSPTEGLLIYQTNLTKGFKYYDGTSWSTFGGGSSDNFGNHIAETDIQLADNWLSNDGDAEGIRIGDDGNVGIGTDAPTRLLELEVDNNGLNLPLFIHNKNGSNGSNGVGIGFNSEQNGNWIKAGIFHERTAGFGVGKMHFLLDNSSNNSSVQLSDSKMTINPNGNVGIGTTSPTAELDVNGDIIARGGDIYENGGTLRLSGEDDVYITMDYNNNDNNSRSIRFGKNSMNSPSELMRIEEGGDVGIGTTNPSYRLHLYQNNLGHSDNILEVINATNKGLAGYFDNTHQSNGYHAVESWTSITNNSGDPFGVFGGSFSSSNGSNGGGVYGHINGRRGIGVLGVRGNTSGGSGFAGLFEGKLGYTGGLSNLSDKRLKKDIENLEGALEIVESLRATTYFFDTELNPHFGLSETKQFGFIAQEIEEVIPEIVLDAEIPGLAKPRGQKESMEDVEYATFKSYDFPQLIPILTKAIQEQQDIIEAMEEKNKDLEARLSALERRMK